MNFKKIFTLGVLATTLVACDNTDNDERLIPITPDMPSTQKNVLIEDFTGMLCVNCPDAAKEIAEIQAVFQNRIVPVAIHPELPQLAGELANELGTTYAQHYGIESLPKGMVDRQAPEDFDKWVTTTAERMSMALPTVDISVTPEFAETGRTLSVNLNLTADSQVEGNLQVWITESNIVSYQLSHEGTIRDYKHNHVLRDAMNGTWGEAVSLSSVATEKAYTYEVPEAWNAQHLAIVAFVYNDADGVIQVVEKKLFEATDDEPETPEAPKMQINMNGEVAPDSYTTTATEGIATIAGLQLCNIGTVNFEATISLNILDNPMGADLEFTVGEETFAASETITTTQILAPAATTDLAAKATFGEGQYGALRAELTIAVGNMVQSMMLVFNNPEPAETEATFRLINNGEVLADGATIEVQSFAIEFAPGVGIVTSSTNNPDTNQQLMVENLTGEDHDVTYTVEVLEKGDATGFQLCAFGGCVPITETSYSKTGTLPANTSITTDWHADFEFGVFGTAKTKMSITVGEETMTVYVNFIYAE